MDVVRRVGVLGGDQPGQRAHQRYDGVGGVAARDGQGGQVEPLGAGECGDHAGGAFRYDTEHGLTAGKRRLGVEHGLQAGQVPGGGLGRDTGPHGGEQTGVQGGFGFGFGDRVRPVGHGGFGKPGPRHRVEDVLLRALA